MSGFRPCQVYATQQVAACDAGWFDAAPQELVERIGVLESLSRRSAEEVALLGTLKKVREEREKKGWTAACRLTFSGWIEDIKTAVKTTEETDRGPPEHWAHCYAPLTTPNDVLQGYLGAGDNAAWEVSPDVFQLENAGPETNHHRMAFRTLDEEALRAAHCQVAQPIGAVALQLPKGGAPMLRLTLVGKTVSGVAYVKQVNGRWLPIDLSANVWRALFMEERIESNACVLVPKTAQATVYALSVDACGQTQSVRHVAPWMLDVAAVFGVGKVVLSKYEGETDVRYGSPAALRKRRIKLEKERLDTTDEVAELMAQARDAENDAVALVEGVRAAEQKAAFVGSVRTLVSDEEAKRADQTVKDRRAHYDRIRAEAAQLNARAKVRKDDAQQLARDIGSIDQTLQTIALSEQEGIQKQQERMAATRATLTVPASWMSNGNDLYVWLGPTTGS